MTRLEESHREPPQTAADPDSFERRWDDWQAKGRTREARTSFRVRVFLAAAGLVAGLVSIWFAVGR